MQQHCNDRLSGEALMMIKEHFIERYGVPKWTIGVRRIGRLDSAAAHRAELPGPARRDAAEPDVPRRDQRAAERHRLPAADELLQDRRGDVDAGEEDAVEGYTPGTCTSWDRSFVNVIVADHAQGCGIPKDQIYDPVKNPKGVRCTMWDTNVATSAAIRRPASRGARSTTSACSTA